jgi:hypothetical protein
MSGGLSGGAFADGGHALGVEGQLAPVIARLTQVFDPCLKVGDDHFEMMAVGALRFWLAGGDGEGVAEDGHRARHRPKAGSLVAFGIDTRVARYGCRAVNKRDGPIRPGAPHLLRRKLAPKRLGQVGNRGDEVAGLSH